MILPVNSARVALIDFPYGLFLALFFMAFWLLTCYFNSQHNLIFRIIILLLFYLSFVINSLLVFYAIVLLYIAYKNYCVADSPGLGVHGAGRSAGDPDYKGPRNGAARNFSGDWHVGHP